MRNEEFADVAGRTAHEIELAPYVMEAEYLAFGAGVVLNRGPSVTRYKRKSRDFLSSRLRLIFRSVGHGWSDWRNYGVDVRRVREGKVGGFEAPIRAGEGVTRRRRATGHA